MKLGDIATALGAKVIGDATRDIRRVVHPADADAASDLALVLTPDAILALSGTRAGALVVRPETPGVPQGVPVIVYAGHERAALATLTRLFEKQPDHAEGVHPAASVSPDATVAGASIGALAAIGPRSRVGTGTIVLPGASVGADVLVGRDCIIHSGVRIGDGVCIGDRVVIYANSVIGADGFSYIPVRNPDGTRNPFDRPVHIRSLGGVVIGDDVDVGAGTTIDRGTLRDTRIGSGTKIDNQVQVAHNVTIGENCIVCGMVGIAGSAEIGDRVILAAGCGIGDHVKVGADSTVTALAGVVTAVPPGSVVDGVPAMPREQAAERFMNIGRLKMLYPRVDDLKKRVEALEKTGRGR